MAIDSSLQYENLHTNYCYGKLPSADFWYPEEAAAKAVRAKTRKVKVQRKAKRSKPWSGWNFFQRARKPLIQEEEKVQPRARISYQTNLKKFVGGMVIIMVMLTYLACVSLGQVAATTQLELVALQRQETELRNEINEMRIVVEQLKGPERIREIATKQLDMVVARDNVYVQGAKVKTIGDFYRNAMPEEENFFYALAK